MQRLLKIVLHVFFHFMAATGIALAAVGSANLAQPQTESNKYSTDNGLIKAGYLILLLFVIILAVYAAYIRVRISRGFGVAHDSEHQRIVENPLMIHPSPLVTWAAAALVLTAARVIYGVVYAFSNDKAKLSPVTGGFAIKFILVFGVQLLAALCLITGGFRSIGRK
jgi:hypothetical protein